FRTAECLLDQRANRRLHPHAMVCAVLRPTTGSPRPAPVLLGVSPPRPPVTCARPHPHGGARVPTEFQPDRPPLAVGHPRGITPFHPVVLAWWPSLEGALGRAQRTGRRTARCGLRLQDGPRRRRERWCVRCRTR